MPDTRLLATIKDLSRKHFDDAVRVRRHIHRNPELSFEEFKTCAFIDAELTAAGIPHVSGIASTGTKAWIEGKKPGPQRVVALRADIDALPVLEETGLEFASCTPGTMHACGHDLHTSILLACARILWALRDEFSGTALLIFQPAEEKMPGGAQAMIAAGALSDPKPDFIIGEHINPAYPVGTLGFRPGLMMGSVDDFWVRIVGRGGHGATPHLAIDPITIGAAVIQSLQQIVSREANPEIPSVLTIGSIHGNGSNNIIPPELSLSGTFRTVNETWRDAAVARIPQIVRGIVAAHGATCELRIERGYPCVENDVGLSQRLKSHALEFGNPVVDLPLVLWAEDFAYYSRVAPSCFYNLGVTPAHLLSSAETLHSPKLLPDESAMMDGAAFMAWACVRELLGNA